MIFVDSNVLSEPMRPKPNQTVVDWLLRNDKECAVSSVVIAEIGFGIASLRPAERSPRLEQHFLEIRRRYASRIYPFDIHAALICAEKMGAKSRHGQVMGFSDGMIAAIALRHSAALATRNTKHFEGLSLQLINPWAE